VAELISEGTIESHVQRMRTVYRRRRDKIATLLEREFPEWRITIPRGLQFFIEAGSSKEAIEVMEACRLHRLRVALPSSYVMPGSNACFILSASLALALIAIPLASKSLVKPVAP
jgi:GntR family transcriptional regulator / MocR family aminotransferase